MNTFDSSLFGKPGNLPGLPGAFMNDLKPNQRLRREEIDLNSVNKAIEHMLNNGISRDIKDLNKKELVVSEKQELNLLNSSDMGI